MNKKIPPPPISCTERFGQSPHRLGDSDRRCSLPVVPAPSLLEGEDKGEGGRKFLCIKFMLPGIVIIGIFIFIFIFKIITLPPEIKNSKLIDIPENTPASGIAGILKKESVIRKKNWFLFLTNKYGVQNKLKAGVYEFHGRTPLKKVIQKLVIGQVALIKVTIPEGSTCRTIGEILENKGLVSLKDFEQYSKKEKLEGFLFPDTYLFPMGISLEIIVNTMLTSFWKEFKKLYVNEFSEQNEKEVRNIVTVASIVEKEATLDSERPIIASVIYNRLKKRLLIRSCATVEYAMGYHIAKLYDKHLKIKSPYNTYLHRGLPPTPICNPGRKSLESAIHPAKTEYIYFVSKGNGENHFSKTYTEHLWARRTFLSNETQDETEIEE